MIFLNDEKKIVLKATTTNTTNTTTNTTKTNTTNTSTTSNTTKTNTTNTTTTNTTKVNTTNTTTTTNITKNATANTTTNTTTNITISNNFSSGLSNSSGTQRIYAPVDKPCYIGLVNHMKMDLALSFNNSNVGAYSYSLTYPNKNTFTKVNASTVLNIPATTDVMYLYIGSLS